MNDLLDRVWADAMWRECFRLARGSVMRPVVGFAPEEGRRAFDAFDIDWALAASAGSSFGAPYVGAFRLAKGDGADRFAWVLVTGRCDTTIGNGADRWDEDSAVDVQIAGSLDDLVRLAMGVEERERLGYPAV